MNYTYIYIIYIAQSFYDYCCLYLKAQCTKRNCKKKEKKRKKERKKSFFVVKQSCLIVVLCNSCYVFVITKRYVSQYCGGEV